MSDDIQYSIVFTGELVDGASLVQVKQKAAQLFKMDEQKIEAIFQSSSVVLKKGLTLPAAQKYQKIIANIGMLVSINDASRQKLPKHSPSSPPSLAEPTSPRESVPNPSIPDWEVKPAGEKLLDSVDGIEQSTDVVAPDFSLAPQPCDILSNEEKKPQAHSPILPNVDAVTIKAVGEPLLEDDEKNIQNQPVIVNIDHLDTQAAGTDLLSSEEKKPPNICLPDTSAITLQENK